jgi:hypothetical protein
MLNDEKSLSWLRVVKTHMFGRHVLNVFYLKDFVTWQVCEMFNRHFSGWGLLRCFLQLPRWSPCSLTDSRIHGLIKTGRFFENPLVGRHVEINLKLIHMAFWV